MRLRTLGSGSSGNCYLLSDNDGRTLILDAGIKSKEIKAALYYDFSSVDGVLISHSHKDHSLSAEELEILGLEVYKPYLIDGGKDRRTFGVWAVQTFDLPHDGCTNCGFYIRHTNGFKMIYVTDYEYVKYTFSKQKVNAILCEANWSKEFVETDTAYAEHKILGHASLDVCKGFIETNKSEELRSVVICHTSNAIDIPRAKEEIRQIVGDGVLVDCAGKGKVIEL